MIAELEPVRAALIARARSDAAAMRAAAQVDARRAMADAQQQADAMLADARAQGRADAAAQLAVEQSRSRRAARAVVLAAQRTAYDELRDRARAAVRELMAVPASRAHLELLIRDRLGDDAVVRVQQDGGLLGETPDGRRLDASVRALVDGALAGLDMEQLWAASHE